MNEYGFDRIERERLITGLKDGYFCEQEHLMVMEIENSILVEAIWREIRERETDCEYMLGFYKEYETEKFVFYSEQNSIRSLEFLDYLITEFGLVKGDARHAYGEISYAILEVLVGQQETKNIMEYILKKAAAYFEECDCVEAESYVAENENVLTSMDVYRKKPVKWAYVRSLDVVEKGQKLRIKSLENESGLILAADKNIYIMIGCRGEIYDITREKFETTYEAGQEPLDIFEQMLDFIPVIETVPEGEYISLDEVAHLCYPKKGKGIYAKQLEKRTKVFSARDNQVYFLGRPGDYLAVRRDDVKDIYVIQKEVFAQTYEKA